MNSLTQLNMQQGIDNEVPLERDLCVLLQNMNLSSLSHRKMPENDVQDVQMQGLACIPAAPSPSPSSNTSTSEFYGCEYLKSVRQQLDSYATTGGEYLEVIFTHREILASYPSAHHQCARGFSDIAYLLEQRAWRADRDADTEAVSTFRHEAWSIAASM